MKFLLIVLAVHFVAEMISSKKKDNQKDADARQENIRHPAEYELR